MNCILNGVYSKERRIRKHYSCARTQFLEANASLIQTAMEIDKPISKQTFRGRRGIQFNTSKDRAKLVDLITSLFDESRKAKHVREQNERRLKRLCHRVFCTSAF